MRLSTKFGLCFGNRRRPSTELLAEASQSINQRPAVSFYFLFLSFWKRLNRPFIPLEAERRLRDKNILWSKEALFSLQGPKLWTECVRLECLEVQQRWLWFADVEKSSKSRRRRRYRRRWDADCRRKKQKLSLKLTNDLKHKISLFWFRKKSCVGWSSLFRNLKADVRRRRRRRRWLRIAERSGTTAMGCC